MTYTCKYPKVIFLLDEFHFKYIYLIDWIKKSILEPGPAFKLEKHTRNNQNLIFFNSTLLLVN